MEEGGEARDEGPAYTKTPAGRRDTREGVDDQIIGCGFYINFIHERNKPDISVTY